MITEERGNWSAVGHLKEHRKSFYRAGCQIGSKMSTEYLGVSITRLLLRSLDLDIRISQYFLHQRDESAYILIFDR